MSDGTCAVCGSGEACGARMSRVVIQGRGLDLCQPHAKTVVAALPKTFDDLLRLFADVVRDTPRTTADRRAPLDRRFFPPRPEGRRLGLGCRFADSLE